MKAPSSIRRPKQYSNEYAHGFVLKQLKIMGDLSLLEKNKLLIQNNLFIAMNKFQYYDSGEEHGVLSFRFARHHKDYMVSLL